MKNIVVMGSTGSVGIQSLDVISKSKSHKVIGLSCYSNADLIFEQTKEYLPNFVAIEVIDPSHNLFNLCKENNIKLITGNNVILVNLVALGGHVEIDDWAILGGASNVHQFCKVGKHAMIAANSKLVQDVPPFILAGKHPVQYSGINSIGLSRRGFTGNDKADIKKAYRYLFRSDLNQSDALAKVKKELSNNNYVDEILHFYESSERGII